MAGRDKAGHRLRVKQEWTARGGRQIQIIIAFETVSLREWFIF